MEKCGPISDLIVRDWVVEDIRSKVLDVTDCIVNQGCKFWQGDDQSAEEIADCLINHLDVSQWTNDEFEYAVRVTNFYCALKFAYLKSGRSHQSDGHTQNITLKIPREDSGCEYRPDTYGSATFNELRLLSLTRRSYAVFYLRCLTLGKMILRKNASIDDAGDTVR